MYDMKAKIISNYFVVISLFLLVSISSCKKQDYDGFADPAPKIVDNIAPTITLITATSFSAHRGDSLDISFTAKDDKGLYFVKVESDAESWLFAKSKSFAIPPKEYKYAVRVGIPDEAPFQDYDLVLGAIDEGYNDAKVTVTVTVAP